MPLWKAVILGLVQGLAEFLPISSSGHLVIIKNILGVDLESGGMFFDVMLHMCPAAWGRGLPKGIW